MTFKFIKILIVNLILATTLIFHSEAGSDIDDNSETISLTKDMVLVPAGFFEMGGSDQENPDETPVHRVYLNSFYIDKYEVTHAQYKKCVTAGACSAPGYRRFYDDPEYFNHPVVYVNWFQAKEYAAWVGKRLPTEAEWEKAARGGPIQKKFPWGDEKGKGKANYNSKGTMKIGSFEPNGYGLYDMGGNVWEWCADWYGEKYYSKAPEKNPTGPEKGIWKALRGASWYNYMDNLRVSNRFGTFPEDNSSIIGFRLALGFAQK